MSRPAFAANAMDFVYRGIFERHEKPQRNLTVALNNLAIAHQLSIKYQVTAHSDVSGIPETRKFPSGS
jgi:hypothetical protein